VTMKYLSGVMSIGADVDGAEGKTGRSKCVDYACMRQEARYTRLDLRAAKKGIGPLASRLPRMLQPQGPRRRC